MSQEPKALEITRPDAYSNFLLGNPKEIARILQGLIDQRSLITAYAKGHSFVTAPIESDDDGYLILDKPSDAEAERMALAAEELVCATQLERVKIQFICKSPEPWSHGGRPALRVEAPVQVLRLQRREFYRLTAPAAHQVMCVIPLTDNNGQAHSFAARVLDISGGGLGILMPPKGVELVKGMEIEDCQITLPESDPIRFRLKICTIFNVTNRNGISMLRIGCEFEKLSGGAENLIQRYILKVERERKAREMGL